MSGSHQHGAHDDCSTGHQHGDDHADEHGDHHGHGHGHGPGHHHHGHDAAGRRRGDRRRLILALGITSTLCIAEVVGGYLSNSLALISDAGHMLSDVLGEVLALLGLLWAERPANKRKTYGYHRVEILMALAQGALLVGLASAVIIQAVRRLWHLEQVETGMMLGVAALGLLGNIVCAALLHGGKSLSVRGAYLHVLLDGLSSVAVMIVGLLLWRLPGLLWLDPILSIAIGLFIFYGSFRLLREAVNILLEAAPHHLDVERIADTLRGLDGVKDVHHLHVWNITSGMPALSAHLLVERAGMGDSDALLDQARALLWKQYTIRHVTLQVESDPCPLPDLCLQLPSI